MITINFKRINNTATLPTKKTETDAGWDLYSCEEVEILPHTQKVIHTGIEFAGADVVMGLPVYTMDKNVTYPVAVAPFTDFNVALLVWPRSGLDAKHGLHVGGGVIDPEYRGEMLVLLKNMSNEPYTIEIGEKIAQFIPTWIPFSSVEEAFENDEETERGKSGGITEVSNENNN